MVSKITVLGDGAWGTACAYLLANNGYPITLWCYNKEVAEAIKQTRYNTQYLPHVALPSSITPVTNLEEALAQAAWIFEAIPVKFLRSIVSHCKSHVTKEQPWVILSKGIENDTLLLPSEVVIDSLGFAVPYVVLSGPSFARDLVHQQPTGVVLASHSLMLTQQLAVLLHNNYFTSIISNDVYGVQLCGALKNCVALAIGILDGAGYSDNTKALAATQGLQEIARIVEQLSGTKDTVYGLAGIGDLILTAFGSQSRNLMLGRQFGQGTSIEDIVLSMKQMPESIHTVKSVYQLIEKLSLSLPLFTTLYKILFQNTPKEALIPVLIQNKKAPSQGSF